ncbi:MAG: tRNA pseudouridine(38-40) synthase TruA [Lentisphaeria bacterium]|nr:tRNA pseudouridine(38-40) synthase TruA [Lentisphaeria bacterium]
MLTKPTPPPPGGDSPVIWHGNVAYDGTRFHGWQVQPNVATVQGEILRRLRLMYNTENVTLAGTSRTDAGVHALDQHFSFADPEPGRFSAEELEARLRRWLPDTIYLKSLTRGAEGFHARHSARGKGYTYTVSTGPAVFPFETRYVWHCPFAVNRDAIRAAAARLIGTHDFTSLAVTTREELVNPVKTIHKLDVIEAEDTLFFNVVGTSFLYKMVRSIVGYLMWTVGRDPDWRERKTDALLAARERDQTVQTAPAAGLFLGKVFFRDDEWKDYIPRLPPWERGDNSAPGDAAIG